MTSPKATTISFWLNADGAWGNCWGTIFVAYNSSGNSDHGYPFSFDTRACLAVHSNLYETYFDDNGNFEYNNGWRTSGADFASSWHHVALVYSLDDSDASDHKVVIKQYIDGTLKQTYNLSNGNTGKKTVSMFDHFEQLTEFVIGGNSPNWDDPDNNYAYDEIAIYDQALSAEQVNQIITDKTTAHTYKVNAVAGGSTIKELASGSTYSTFKYSANAPKVIVKDEKYYVLDDGQEEMNGSQATYTMGASNIVKEINYTLDESIVYFQEAESFAGSFSSTAESRASGGAYTSYYRSNTSGAVKTLDKGVYSVETYIWGRTDKEINLYKTAKDNANILASLTGSGSQSKNFLIEANSTATVIGCVNNSCCFDYILIRKLYDVTNPDAVVGNVNYSGYATSSDYTMKKGETKVFTFQNYGKATGESWDNWRINVIEGETWKSVTRADSWDEKGGSAGTGAATKVSYKVSKDGGSSKVNLDWNEYKTDLANARVVATLAYGLDGTLAITTTSTSAKNGYIYYVDQDVTGLTSDLTVNLAANYSWLEVLSVENTAVGGTIASSGYSSLASAYGLNFSSATVSSGTLTAYVVDDITKDAVKLKSVDELPANKGGVILKGTAGATYSIPVKSTAVYVGTNKLQAAVTATDIAANTAYILQSGEFHLVTEASTVPAGKAYLLASDVPAEARSLIFAFDDQTTGISATLNDKGQLINDKFVYNLQGQRVNAPTKGLYIVNGKKVIMK